MGNLISVKSCKLNMCIYIFSIHVTCTFYNMSLGFFSWFVCLVGLVFAAVWYFETRSQIALASLELSM